MAYPVLNHCPVCQKKLKITQLTCKECGTVIENEFEFSNLSRLTAPQLSFTEIFIKCRGNIKEVEKEMGISYPTVRSKLDEVIAAMGYNQPKSIPEEKTNVLEMLEKGEISPEEAIKILKR